MSRYRLLGISCFLPAIAALALESDDANACGACFHPPPPPPPPQILNVPPPPNEVDTVVTAHRMAFAMSTTQSVLWDQIRYSGNPKEFAWVLPVKPGTQVQLSTDAWLAALDANTATIIEPPPLPTCYAPQPAGEGFGGGGGGNFVGGGGFGGGGPGGGTSYCPPGGNSAAGDTLGGGGGGCGCGSPGRPYSWFGLGAPSSDTCASFGGNASVGGGNSANSGGTGSPSGGATSGGFGGSSGAGSKVSPPAPPPVTVQVQETVGPYEVVIVRASMGEALDTWLITNGFEIPPNIQPILDSYVAQKLDFVALKLRPGANVSAMRPVRVIEPGADPTLPLRMISAGAGAHVGITLWVISEGRYEPKNFPMATIDFSKLVYDVANRRSNYAELRAAALSAVPPSPAASDAATTADVGVGPDAETDAAFDADAGAIDDAGIDDAAIADAAESGTAADAATAASSGFWLTEFAGLANIGGGSAPASSGNTPALLSAYLQACMPGTPPNPCGNGVGDAGDDGAVEAGPVAQANKQSDVSANASQEAGSSDSGADDGAPSDADAACVPPAPTVCDDAKVALAGLHTGAIWITRLEADLPYSALAQDLVLQASATQARADNVHKAQSWTDGNPCSLGTIGTQSEAITTRPVPRRAALARPSQSCTLGSRSPADVVGTGAIAGLTALWLTRRKRRALARTS